MPKPTLHVAGFLLPAILALSGLPRVGAEPVATVNGQAIDRAALYEYMVKRHGYRSLINLITAEVIAQEAKKQGVVVTDEEIEAGITRKRENLDRTAIETGADFEAMLSAQAETIEMFRESERTLLMLKKMVQDQAQITEDQVRDHYQKHQEDFRLKEAMRVSYLRVDKADQATEIRQNIIAGNVTFEQAAGEFSNDSYTKDAGGKVDRWLTRGGTPFLRAAFALLQDGDISDVVPFPGLGFYLIRRDQYVRDYLLDYDEIKAELKDLLTDQVTQRLALEKQRELLRAADVKFLIEWPPGTWPPDAGETTPEPETGLAGTQP